LKYPDLVQFVVHAVAIVDDLETLENIVEVKIVEMIEIVALLAESDIAERIEIVISDASGIVQISTQV
jgi:hypothetical protein